MHAYLVGLIGSGIDASLTPLVHEQEAASQGMRYIYRTLDIDRLRLSPAEAVRLVRQAADLGYDALNVTHPCKQLVLDEMDELSADAQVLGAVNTVLFRDGRVIGHNTDHSGFSSGFRNGFDRPALERVVLLGSGGAGAAIAFALLRAGVRQLGVFDPLPGRAAHLVEALAPHFADARLVAVHTDGLPAAVAGAVGLVNATPIGMVGHPGSPISPELLHAGLWVADAIYRPVRTELLMRAQALGCPTLDGGWMAVGQAIDTFELITGVRPDAQRMRAHFLDLVRRGADLPPTPEPPLSPTPRTETP